MTRDGHRQHPYCPEGGRHENVPQRNQAEASSSRHAAFLPLDVISRGQVLGRSCRKRTLWGGRRTRQEGRLGSVGSYSRRS
jgi:hypothetical protein